VSKAISQVHIKSQTKNGTFKETILSELSSHKTHPPVIPLLDNSVSTRLGLDRVHEDELRGFDTQTQSVVTQTAMA